ncbi:phosphatidate cytidylyltransferase, putative [Plasmodium berghei]|uniref:dolichol kinase n=2 Tax=Plasmodium berghei TaxID=5821 RepID=A0A509AH28_PLABA|nr:phosphatidate cytidylyltransferase, putative [Plasmodium berghei ANKA]CXH86251.1 phosphatidate cytidylyltransferase, putative [Plasmodium berghei]SCL89966.1 phosphatidate cytidylyltransferase, putative [Plasmodium berghei]SCM15188.1 phosphatidate cytidylyltransferase, putative [Plasmodium berghei]SCM16983.1 phosphatidate cytidylyltransferase, putative [Plasmodium berghei]SCN21811.1 phosphatidate cytidylyltransferase, putative [Plasmodium berghei]|eukprot:XP_034419764.1 phosphatidate cytidylyltransferase, putative [Plasmodium berghei ANKA]
MINILLVCLLSITNIQKNNFISYQYTYIWLFLTILCNAIIVVNLYYENGVKGKYEKWKNNDFFPFISCSLTIGKYYKGEALSSWSNIIKNKKNDKFYNFPKKTKLLIDFLKLFVCTYVENFFSFFFLPFLSTLLFLKYGIFRYEIAKLSLIFVNLFAISSVCLRYVQINILSYILCHISLFAVTLAIIKVKENVFICFLLFMVIFTFYHILLIAIFCLANKVFSFMNGVLISTIGAIFLTISLYSLTYDYLNIKVFPGPFFLILSKLILSTALYGGYCAYFIQNGDEKKQNKRKIIISTFFFFFYNIYNFFFKEYNIGNINGRKFVDYAMSLIRMNDNFILIASWFFITILYLIFINFLTKKRANLIYVRKHYHFLLFLNTNLAFWAGKVELLTIVLSFILPLFILIEILRKNYENSFNSNNWLNRFFTRFIDDRDRQGLILTHIYLLAGVYLPIAIDVVLSNTNYIYDKKEIIYLFRETNLILYCSGLHSICIGDSFAAIGGRLYLTPKITKTNNKSYLGFFFFFCTTFVSLLFFSYLQKNDFTNTKECFIISLFGAIFEAYLNDIDNLLLPIFSFCVYLCFEE